MDEYYIRVCKKALPLMAIFVAFIGGCCSVGLAPIEMVERSMAMQYSGFGVVGTLGVAALVRKLSREDADWEFLHLRRNLVLFLLCLCWLVGAVGGLFVFCLIPRQVI